MFKNGIRNILSVIKENICSIQVHTVDISVGIVGVQIKKVVIVIIRRKNNEIIYN